MLREGKASGKLGRAEKGDVVRLGRVVYTRSLAKSHAHHFSEFPPPKKIKNERDVVRPRREEKK